MEKDFQEDINRAIDTLKKGGIILYPTDTIWGLGCDARNSEAVKKIYEIKRRTDSKSLIVLVNNEMAVERLVEDIPETAFQLLEVVIHPLTIIYDKAYNVAPELKSEDGSLGIRITKEKFSSELCRKFGGPIVSTSANISGEPAPKNFKEISEEIRKKVNYIVNYRQHDNTISEPSNIIKISNDNIIKIIR